MQVFANPVTNVFNDYSVLWVAYAVHFWSSRDLASYSALYTFSTQHSALVQCFAIG